MQDVKLPFPKTHLCDHLLYLVGGGLNDVFADKNTAPKQIFTHITTATDSENIKVVFDAVKLTIINDSLRRGGLL